MKKLIVMGLLLMGVAAFASEASDEAMLVSENSRLSRPTMIQLFADYGNR